MLCNRQHLAAARCSLAAVADGEGVAQRLIGLHNAGRRFKHRKCRWGQQVVGISGAAWVGHCALRTQHARCIADRHLAAGQGGDLSNDGIAHAAIGRYIYTCAVACSAHAICRCNRRNGLDEQSIGRVSPLCTAYCRATSIGDGDGVSGGRTFGQLGDAIGFGNGKTCRGVDLRCRTGASAGRCAIAAGRGRVGAATCVNRCVVGNATCSAWRGGLQRKAGGSVLR